MGVSEAGVLVARLDGDSGGDDDEIIVDVVGVLFVVKNSSISLERKRSNFRLTVPLLFVLAAAAAAADPTADSSAVAASFSTRFDSFDT